MYENIFSGNNYSCIDYFLLLQIWIYWALLVYGKLYCASELIRKQHFSILSGNRRGRVKKVFEYDNFKTVQDFDKHVCCFKGGGVNKYGGKSNQTFIDIWMLGCAFVIVSILWNS